MSFDCSICMACCLEEGGLPIEQLELEGRPLTGDMLKEAEARSAIYPTERIWQCAWLDLTQDSIDGGPCGKCLHYDQRPKVCRDYLKGGAACLNARAYAGLASS